MNAELIGRELGRRTYRVTLGEQSYTVTHSVARDTWCVVARGMRYALVDYGKLWLACVRACEETARQLKLDCDV